MSPERPEQIDHTRATQTTIKYSDLYIIRCYASFEALAHQYLNCRIIFSWHVNELSAGENKNRKDFHSQIYMWNADISWCFFPENLTELMQTETQSEA